MNTPAHVAVNLMVLAPRLPLGAQLAVIAGAVLPDAPMYWFYFEQKVLRGRPGSVIWGEAYFEPGWQTLFDLFNSAPLALAALAAAWLARARLAVLLFASCLLHFALDLPLHRDDAHRHLFPFTDWRFVSPVSYWDPAHYGRWVTVVEALTVLVCCALLYRWATHSPARVIVGLLGVGYLAYFGYVFTVWDGIH